MESIVTAAQEAADQMRAEAEQMLGGAEQSAEQIRADAQQAADQMRADAEHESAGDRRDAEREAKRILKEARTEAKEIEAAARLEAMGLEDQARKDAEARLEVAQDAADEALADARAMSEGLQRLGAALGDQAQQILRDVQAAHRRLAGDLRIAGARERPPAPAATVPPRAPGASRARADEAAAITELAARERERDRGSGGAGARRGRFARGSSADELDVPSWVEPGS